ncbi:hypothetical protein [Phenylobacterium sp.]|jgi:hypothetical protein|uniref:hypothetical protein n=1 Tax=Phenylobacterium sp. TaxID=1871053 RepID=UPI002E329D22|nr:hypothetical protein [Phenylobacterium sp.]HEX2559276.1 hypothetical protein [Phenylobacterium sp.]
MSPSLSVVADNGAALIKGEANLSERIRRLQTEAKNLAREHIMALEAALVEVERIAGEIADGGEAYPVGIREIARRLSEESETRVQAMEAILRRN